MSYDSRRPAATVVHGVGIAPRMYTDTQTYRTLLRLLHSPKTASWRRLALNDTLLGVIGTVIGANRVGTVLDERLYPEFRQQPLGKPIYIVAAPRSGTTFLHRLMALDEQFTTFKMHQTMLSTLVGYRLMERAGKLNGLVGAGLSALRGAIDKRSFGAWEGIHDTGLSHDEEDESFWVLAMASPAFLLMVPFWDELDDLRFVDHWPEHRRQPLVEYYREYVQRHLYYHQGKTLLAKNVFLPGRFGIVTDALPDARFVHIMRHPYEAIASSLSLFTEPWRAHSPEIAMDGPEVRALAQLTVDYYRFLHEKSQQAELEGSKRFFNVTYRELVADPMGTIRDLYSHFDLELRPEFVGVLKGELEQQKAFSSTHRYSLDQFGITRAWVREQLAEVFEHCGFDPDLPG